MWWMYLLIGVIVLIIIAVGILFYLRNIKQNDVTKEKQRLEAVLQLPFNLELEKLNAFNLNGEAKDLYDNLDLRWNETLNENKIQAEFNITEADAKLAKFSFGDSNESRESAKSHVDTIESTYDNLSNEIKTFMSRTELSDEKYEESGVLLREANRDVLANGHQFGDSRKPLEALIASYEPELKKYKDLVNEGNYLTAANHIDEVHEDLIVLKRNMEEIPTLIKEVQKDLPTQFQEIRYGCRDLKLDGYDLEHIKVDSKLSTLRSELNLIEPKIAKLELDEARDDLDDINEKLDEMYDLIEHEVEAKIKYDSMKDQITDQLFKAKATNFTLRTEMDYIKNQFYINEGEFQTIHKYEQKIERLVAMYSDIQTESDKNTTRYSKITDNLDHIQEEVERINSDQTDIEDYLQSIKEDEKEAIENTNFIDDKKEEVMHALASSNLVEIPEKFVVMKNELDIEVDEIDRYLERRPMNVQYIKEKVNKAVKLLNEFEQDAYEIIHDSELTEQIIQYANRYRKDDESLDMEIKEAVRLFNEGRYKRALELSTNALDRVDEEGLQRIINYYENN
ncbi:septation ring formation regulator EzrA [Phocicoccus pinnipedialis]|uniref:Septation ring formation regulator EzrA n=1 Tax=Phocicoccus pinnipedialis TaxID=110845 RepID=A0A6V7RCS2_9BACL|nr:septation ring formation regulator EzrA [Jeotgalicoccus pinnipedialis]MBP1939515.1 septation ring formation regulator [Jeotgalicoccus pinnipedialis]CAD2075065.1 Septation ring formation regulator EzrA [Jeotgalicoccus pinnipedialis]